MMSCKWSNFIEFYRLSGIYFPQYYSCRLCVCGGFFSHGGWKLPLWLLSLLLSSRITGQVRDKLWPKCQFQFHVHCIFFFKLMIKLVHIWFTNTPKQKAKHFFLYLFSLTAFSWLKQHKRSAISFYSLMKWIKTSQRITTSLPAREIISYFQSWYVWEEWHTAMCGMGVHWKSPFCSLSKRVSD